MLQTMQTNLGTQMAESLAFKTSAYLQGVYDVVALKRDAETVVENRKLDYELLERWIKYMEKPTDKYKYKEAWQAMMKRTLAARGSRRRPRWTRRRHGRSAIRPPAAPAPAGRPQPRSSPICTMPEKEMARPCPRPNLQHRRCRTPAPAAAAVAADSVVAAAAAGRRGRPRRR